MDVRKGREEKTEPKKKGIHNEANETNFHMTFSDPGPKTRMAVLISNIGEKKFFWSADARDAYIGEFA